jgi:hypothetical protein
LRVYSFDEAGAQFRAAIALIDANPGCADDLQIVEMLSHFALFATLTWRMPLVTTTIERFRAHLERVGDSHDAIIVQHHHANALLVTGRYRDCAKLVDALLGMAARLGDARAIAYAHGMRLHVAAFLGPAPREDFDSEAAIATKAAAEVNDPQLQYLVRHAIGIAEFYRGRAQAARDLAEEILSIGRTLDDPRSISWAMLLKALIAGWTGGFEESRECAEIGVSMARAPTDVILNEIHLMWALLASGRPEALPKLEEFRRRRKDDGSLLVLALTDGVWGVALAIQGKLAASLRWIEASIARADNDGPELGAWLRVMLCEVLLQVVSAKDRPSLAFLARNLGPILRIALTVESHTTALVGQIRQSPMFVPGGIFDCHSTMILGLLYKARKKRALAVEHLTEARRIAAQFGPTAMRARIEAALAELG